jgi:hypothetical protein
VPPPRCNVLEDTNDGMPAHLLKICKGSHGADKLHLLPRDPPESIVVVFGGDLVLALPEVRPYQDPATLCELLGRKFPCSTVVL